MDTSLISPPLTADTPVGSLSGYVLAITCPQCGEKELPVDTAASTPAIYASPIGAFLGRLKCPACKQKPVRVEAECAWVKRYQRTHPRIDLTWLLPPADEREQRAPQKTLFG